jgi:hypothetical protein
MKEQKRDKEFDKKIIDCIQNNYSFYAWKSLNGTIEKCELKGKAIRCEYEEIELEARLGSEKLLENVVSGNRKISIYIPEMGISFLAQLKNISADGKLKIVIPEEYGVHERRKHERVMPEKKCYVTVEIKSQMYKKAIYDFSMGGFAIIVPKTEKLGIAKDAVFASVILEIPGIKEKIKAKVICVSSFAFDRFRFNELPYGGYKIAFCFKDLSPDSKKVIDDFMLTELLNQSTRKKAN